jgi:hypothetical protein
MRLNGRGNSGTNLREEISQSLRNVLLILFLYWQNTKYAGVRLIESENADSKFTKESDI